MSIKHLLSSSRWLPRYTNIAELFKSNDAAILLSDLLNRDTYFEEHNPKYDGWIYALSSEIEKTTVCSPHIQRKWFGVFAEIGLLQVERRSTPAKNYYKIDEKALQALIDARSAIITHLDVEYLKILICNNCIPLYNNNKKNNNKEIDKSISVRPKINGKSSLKENNNTIYFKLAKKLSKIIQKKKNITHTNTQIKAWSEDLRKLATVNKVNSARQKEILKWYKKAIGGKYIPVVESGKSFRDKFTKLEDAMNRSDSENSNSFGYKGDFKLTKKYTTL